MASPYDDLYREMQRDGLTHGSLKKVTNWGWRKVAGRMRHYAKLLPVYPPRPAASKFEFVASSTIAGTGTGCMDPSCRWANAEDLTLFAAAFADHISIPTRMWDWLDTTEPHPYDVMRALGDLSVLLTFMPLLRANIVDIEPDQWHFCESHRKTEYQPIQEAIKYLESELTEQLRSTASFSIVHDRGFSTVEIHLSDPLISGRISA